MAVELGVGRHVSTVPNTCSICNPSYDRRCPDAGEAIVLLKGINHVAVITNDSDRLHAFYREVFDAEIFADIRTDEGGAPGRLSFVTIGPYTQLNVFEIAGNTEADRQVPMFGRGRIDHIGLEAASQEAFDEIRERLIARGATDGFVTDFGAAISLFFVDPDGLEGEVALHNPAATSADLKPPGTPAAGYERVR
jgi:catechol 2,3-dioxygenase-like lactoylglutathione lyase family enzyme